ncbi:hypothetical protein [Methylobacterium radiodurans]|uniref:Uncharacterized protein n=1 Tax=Methylobacterium radiodurans TaxID=2202828 RepID=A0A2U8VVE3_9HYPH|nr:hypothetical protein [Methylobacterium radiodurans]AWN37675.1 hypothetical protein DK427_19700 [Methylobacterium radiodurans]
MILIDNDVLSQLNRPRPDPSVKAWFAGLRPYEFGIAGVTVFEQFRGIALVRGRNATLAHTLSLWWEGFLATLAPEQLIAAHVDVLREQAELYAHPRAEP